MKYSKSEAKRIAITKGWSSKLGYSKEELGIKTPKNPQPKNLARRKARAIGTTKAWDTFRRNERNKYAKN